MNTSNSSSISKTNSNIMEYLYQKMEAKSKTISTSKQLINNIYDLQSLQINKRGLLSLFSDLEDDLRQSSFAIKGLLADNKALAFELEQLRQKHCISEENKAGYINELTNRNNLLLDENEDLKEQLAKLTNPSNNMNINSLVYDKELNDITEENNIDTQSQKQQTDNDGQRSSSQKNKNNKSGVKKLGNIITDMRNNKQKLKDVIDQHFTNEHEQNNNCIVNEGKKKQEVNSNKKKSSEVLMRVMSSQENINVLNQKMGNDFMQKMLSKDVTDEYLTQIENILNETEEPIREKIPIRIRSCKSKSKSKEKMKNKNESRSLSTSYTKISTSLYQTQSLKPNTPFETSLRDYPKRTKNGSRPKFNHYLNPYGKYFMNPNEEVTTNIKPISR